MKIEGLLFREAVEIVATVTGMAAVTSRHVAPPSRTATEQPITLFLPEKAGLPIRLYDYLCVKRGIDSGIVNTLIQKGVLYEDRRGNVVFVSYDEQGKPRFASVRGTYDRLFRMDCEGSDKRYGFNMAFASSERLYIFESPIDAMSHGSIENLATGDTGAWRRDNRLSLAGTSDAALAFFLNKHKEVRELVFCLDNDPPGREAAAVLARKYAGKGYKVLSELTAGKDYNDDLKAIRAQIQTEKHAGARRCDERAYSCDRFPPY
jgi:hypothetical protein